MGKAKGGISKTAKAAQKTAKVNTSPLCCSKPMLMARMMTSTGKIRGMAWYCDVCSKEKAK